MSGGRTRAGTTAVLVAWLALMGALAGCGGGAADEEPASSPSSEEATAALGVEAPAGVSVTDPGSELGFGETADVVWQPSQGRTGAIRVGVVSVQQADVARLSAFSLSSQARRSTPYFVRVEVENLGEESLAGVPVPLYLLDSSGTLVERSTFGSRFDACPSLPLPPTFDPGDTTRTCQVFLAPEGTTAEAISFRPTEEFVPITWTGEIATR